MPGCGAGDLRSSVPSPRYRDLGPVPSPQSWDHRAAPPSCSVPSEPLRAAGGARRGRTQTPPSFVRPVAHAPGPQHRGLWTAPPLTRALGEVAGPAALSRQRTSSRRVAGVEIPGKLAVIRRVRGAPGHMFAAIYAFQGHERPRVSSPEVPLVSCGTWQKPSGSLKRSLLICDVGPSPLFY